MVWLTASRESGQREGSKAIAEGGEVWPGGSHSKASTFQKGKPGPPVRPKAQTHEHHNRPSRGGVPRLRTRAPPRSALCVRTAYSPPPRKTAGACGRAEQWLPGAHGERAGLALGLTRGSKAGLR
jgi:hypothetical protein